jgi:uncharacterized protein DUF4253
VGGFCHTASVDLTDLPNGVPCRLDGVDLPVGRLVRPNLDAEPGEPVLWATDERLPAPGDIWGSLSASAAAVDLVAVLLDELERGAESGRPWTSGELDPQRDHSPDDYDEAVVFRQRWKMYVPIGSLPPEERPPPLLPGREREYEEDPEETAMFLEEVAPWGILFPGLALAERSSIDPALYGRAVSETPPARVGLVQTERPADIPHTIGWIGATNHFIRRDPPGETVLSVMMRSWEDRFGARLFRLGFDTMTFLVERPPSTEASALAVAAEHFAFAGQDGFQAYHSGVASIRTLASTILGAPLWHFWWD